jgi:hypothetical protein
MSLILFSKVMVAKGFLRKTKKMRSFSFFISLMSVCHIYLYKHLWGRVAVLLANLVRTKPFNLQEEKRERFTGTGFTEVCNILTSGFRDKILLQI